jgi:predicted nuclease with TOPRIM domain
MTDHCGVGFDSKSTGLLTREATVMEQILPGETEDRIRRWIDESRQLLTAALPAIVHERDELKGRLKDVEGECERLRDDNASVRIEMDRLREDHEKLSREHAEIVDQLSRFTGQMTQILGPMSELARHIREHRPVG